MNQVAAPCAYVAVAICAALFFMLDLAVPAAESSHDWLDRAGIEAVRRPDGILVKIPVNNPAGKSVDGRLTVSITDLDGNVLLQKTEPRRLAPGLATCSLHVPGTLAPDRDAQAVIHCELVGPGMVEKAVKSFFEAVPQLETRVVAYRDLLAGSRASLRLAASNHATGEPVEGAAVVIKLAADGSEHVLYTGSTDADGSIDARFDVPGDIVGSAELRITASAPGLGEDRIVQSVTVQRKVKILLTTDKPLYQPGQLIQMRALSLGAANLMPEAHRPFVFEVMDSKGNKVFKKKTDTDAFGVASATFQLAGEVNLGGYIVRAILDETTSEKQVTVDRYVLPKFKIEAKTDRDYYLPGETLKGEVQADYFFGKPVAGGKVHIAASKFEIEFEPFGEVDGTLDPNGHWSLDLPHPA